MDEREHPVQAGLVLRPFRRRTGSGTCQKARKDLRRATGKQFLEDVKIRTGLDDLKGKNKAQEADFAG